MTNLGEMEETTFLNKEFKFEISLDDNYDNKVKNYICQFKIFDREDFELY